MPKYRRGDVWLANLDPVISSEQGKTRPVVIVQNDVANEYSPVVTIAAITSAVGHQKYPTEAHVGAQEGGLKRDSVILLNQIRTIDKRRLVKRMGQLSRATMKQVDEALRISLGLVPL